MTCGPLISPVAKEVSGLSGLHTPVPRTTRKRGAGNGPPETPVMFTNVKLAELWNVVS